MLLDFQVVRYSSLATDLNHFLFTSLDSKAKLNTDEFLKYYYTAYCNVINSTPYEPPFTYEELVAEFKLKKPFGCLMALWMIPFVTLNTEDLLEMDSFKDDQEAMRQTAIQGARLIELAKCEGSFRSKFLGFIDSVVE